MGCNPNPDELSRSQRSGDPAAGVAAKRISNFIGEVKIENFATHHDHALNTNQGHGRCGDNY